MSERPYFRLQFDCSNDVFKADACGEIVSVLRTLADKIESGFLGETPNRWRNVYDINGNHIGAVRFAFEPTAHD